MTTILTPAAAGRPKVGRPADSGVDPLVLHLEGHVEEITALHDDVEAFVRCRHAIGHVRESILRYKMTVDLATTLEQAQRQSECLARLSHVMSRLAHELAARAARLVERVIPEVQRCYSAFEAAREARA